MLQSKVNSLFVFLDVSVGDADAAINATHGLEFEAIRLGGSSEYPFVGVALFKLSNGPFESPIGDLSR